VTKWKGFEPLQMAAVTMLMEARSPGPTAPGPTRHRAQVAAPCNILEPPLRAPLTVAPGAAGHKGGGGGTAPEAHLARHAARSARRGRGERGARVRTDLPHPCSNRYDS
jgi:hypothetical protein